MAWRRKELPPALVSPRAKAVPVGSLSEKAQLGLLFSQVCFPTLTTAAPAYD